LMATWFVIVPEGQKIASSLPNIAAAKACKEFTVGSSPHTSSPTLADICRKGQHTHTHTHTHIKNGLTVVQHKLATLL